MFQIQTTGTGATPQYDAAGDYACDNYNTNSQTCTGPNQFLYDAEGRICAVSALGVMTGYLYDAEGNRVAKGSITSWSCNTATNGFTMTQTQILGPGNEQLTELTWSGGAVSNWHTNVWTPNGLDGTYSQTGSQAIVLNFYLTDWLGTRRVTTDMAGNAQVSCLSLPYGNGETCTPTPTEHLFTGKERDAESGNDYFPARYYASSMGRFLSPDPSGLVFADPNNPQSLNLYSYVHNNPLLLIDPTGEFCYQVNGNSSVTIDNKAQSASQCAKGATWWGEPLC